MSQKYRVSSHEVEGSKIVNVQPLLASGKMLSPDAGLVLVLENDSKHNWVAEKNNHTPSVGDFLISDTELNVVFVVDAAKFKQLFRVKE